MTVVEFVLEAFILFLFKDLGYGTASDLVLKLNYLAEISLHQNSSTEVSL